jgi:hypothetical protein
VHLPGAVTRGAGQGLHQGCLFEREGICSMLQIQGAGQEVYPASILSGRALQGSTIQGAGEGLHHGLIMSETTFPVCCKSKEMVKERLRAQF